jgi:hypothetical protein
MTTPSAADLAAALTRIATNAREYAIREESDRYLARVDRDLALVRAGLDAKDAEVREERGRVAILQTEYRRLEQAKDAEIARLAIVKAAVVSNLSRECADRGCGLAALRALLGDRERMGRMLFEAARGHEKD